MPDTPLHDLSALLRALSGALLRAAPDPDDPHPLIGYGFGRDRTVSVECRCSWAHRYPTTEEAKDGHTQHRAEVVPQLYGDPTV